MSANRSDSEGRNRATAEKSVPFCSPRSLGMGRHKKIRTGEQKVSENKDTGPEAGVKGIVEDVKGKAKEAAGAIAGKDELRREGRAQQDKAAAERDVAAKEAEAEKARAEAEAHEAEQRSHQS
jgi:uncharacterized protein YjbJ (UPF0337 family)